MRCPSCRVFSLRIIPCLKGNTNTQRNRVVEAGGGIAGKTSAVLRDLQVQYGVPKTERSDGDIHWEGPHLNFAH